MKRIFAYTVLVLALVGCTVTNPSNPTVTSTELIFYSTSHFGHCVAMPAELMNVVLDFDEYLKKSEEDMIHDKNFYGVASYLGENSYRISHHKIGLSCTLDTGGKSILDQDAVWEFSNISYYGYYGDSSIGMSYDIYLNEVSSIKMLADSTWSFTGPNIESTLEMVKTDSTRCWNVQGRSIENTEDIYSVSTTGEEGMKIWCIDQNIDEKYSSRSLSYSGTFATDIYKDDKVIDFCRFAFRPGFNSTITTSRN